MNADQDLLLHCIHNALWMAEHESQMQAVDKHIAVLSPAQKARAKDLLREIMETAR